MQKYDYPVLLSQQDVIVLMQGLGELPLKVSGEVFGKLQFQIEAEDRRRHAGEGDGSPSPST